MASTRLYLVMKYSTIKIDVSQKVRGKSMNSIVKLPFYENPIFTTYNNYSFVTGIIQGNHNNSFEPWAYGRYINCRFNPNYGFHIGKLLDVWKGHNAYIKIVNRKYGIISLSKKIAHMKSLLSEGYYIMIVLDEQYIPGMTAYKQRKFMHDSLLIGYDEDKKAFLLYGRLADYNLHLIEVSYNDIEKAVAKDSWSFILEYYSKSNEQLDINQIRTELSHYLYSALPNKRVRSSKYGISAVVRLCEYLEMQLKYNNDLDFRYTRGLTEQKALMFNMCKYLNTNGYNLSEDILALCKESADAAQKIHLLALKSYANVKSNHNLSERIKKQFDILINCERKYIPMLLKQLSDY